MGPAFLKGIFSGWRQIAKGKIKQFQVGLSTTKNPNQPTKTYNSELEGYRMSGGQGVGGSEAGAEIRRQFGPGVSEARVSSRKPMFRIRFLASGKVASSCNSISQA